MTWRLVKKRKMDVPYDPATSLLGIYPQECDSSYSRGSCTAMFIAALFTVAKLWQQPRYPSTDKCIKKMWYLFTMEFYLAMKKTEILSFTSKWMELEKIFLSKVSPGPEDQKSHVSLYVDLDLGKRQ
jgi:hypothetical protein